MPPKVKITKEDIVQSGLDIVRWEGEEGLNARNIAAALGCSTQPIFSNFNSMEDLRMSVVAASEDLFTQYMHREMALGQCPAYKACGKAYIRFAKEERNLFRLLYMRDRTGETGTEESRLFDQMETMVHNNTGLENDRARRFHLEIWSFVHGVAAMMATGYLQLDMDLVSEMMTDVYQGLKHRFEKE